MKKELQEAEEKENLGPDLTCTELEAGRSPRKKSVPQEREEAPKGAAGPGFF